MAEVEEEEEREGDVGDRENGRGGEEPDKAAAKGYDDDEE